MKTECKAEHSMSALCQGHHLVGSYSECDPSEHQGSIVSFTAVNSHITKIQE